MTRPISVLCGEGLGRYRWAIVRQVTLSLINPALVKRSDWPIFKVKDRTFVHSTFHVPCFKYATCHLALGRLLLQSTCAFCISQTPVTTSHSLSPGETLQEYRIDTISYSVPAWPEWKLRHHSLHKVEPALGDWDKMRPLLLCRWQVYVAFISPGALIFGCLGYIEVAGMKVVPPVFRSWGLAEKKHVRCETCV